MAAQEGSDFHVQENIPPGFRFMPTDKELLYYLNLKILNKQISIDAIKDVDIYKYHPSDLCQSEMNGTHEGYFFTSRTRKYHKGNRPDRTAADGYWKATGGDIILHSSGQEVGRKKVLVYYERKSDNSKGAKTNWIMHEYTIHQMKDVACSSTNAIPDDKMLDKCVCRIYNRTTKSSKNKEQDTQTNMIQETHVPDANLSATSSYLNPVPALDHSSLQGAYLPDQQSSINDQYQLIHEPVTYMRGDMAIQSNVLPSPELLTYFGGDHILPSPQPLVHIPGDQTNVTLYNHLIPPETGMQSSDQHQPITHMNGDVGTSRFAASTSNDDGIYLDFMTPYFSPRFDLSPPMDPSILDSLLGDSSNAQLQSSPIPPGQSIEWLGHDNILPQWDLPSPPIEWFDHVDLLPQLDPRASNFPLDDSSNMQFQFENGSWYWIE